MAKFNDFLRVNTMTFLIVIIKSFYSSYNTTHAGIIE